MFDPSNDHKKMKLIALIATAAMAVGFYSAAEANTVTSAKKAVICEQQNNGVVVCPSCQGRGNFGSQACLKCKGRGMVKANGMPW